MISSAQGEGNAGTVRTRTKRVGRATVRQLSLSSAPRVLTEGRRPAPTGVSIRPGGRPSPSARQSQQPGADLVLAAVFALGLANTASAVLLPRPRRPVSSRLRSALRLR